MDVIGAFSRLYFANEDRARNAWVTQHPGRLCAVLLSQQNIYDLAIITLGMNAVSEVPSKVCRCLGMKRHASMK
jgi:hypothetical protein